MIAERADDPQVRAFAELLAEREYLREQVNRRG